VITAARPKLVGNMAVSIAAMIRRLFALHMIADLATGPPVDQ
jgi:hypothetical protein